MFTYFNRKTRKNRREGDVFDLLIELLNCLLEYDFTLTDYSHFKVEKVDDYKIVRH